MATKILMPELGESVIEGVVAEWFKQVGESLTAGEPLVLMETEKVTQSRGTPWCHACCRQGGVALAAAAGEAHPELNRRGIVRAGGGGLP